jgi:type IV pilus assembly protein PilP
MRALVIVLAFVFAASSASGQDKPVTVPPQPPAAAVAPAPTYVYNPEGRRDPFVSLLKRAVDVKGRQGKAPAGVTAFLVSELVLKGIMQSRGDHVALVTGPDSRTYMVRANDRLLDGSVRAITADTLVCLQDVNDPLSLTKQREVRMTLRAVADAK